MDPFEEWQQSVRRAKWAFENMHIVIAGSGGAVLVFNIGFRAIFF